MPIYRDRYKSISLTRPEDNDEATIKEIEALNEEEYEAFLTVINNPDIAPNYAAHEYDRDMVDIEDWLNDDYFMGNVTKDMYPVWREDLIEIFRTGLYSTAILSGSTGSGKSYVSHLLILRMIYEASCLKDPAQSYGLSKGSVIGFCTIASSKETARRVVFEGIQAKMRESPYFKYDFAPKKENKDEILFSKGLAIIAGSSTDTSIIGMNIFGGVMDEGNFVRTNTNSVGMSSSSSLQRQRNLAKAQRLYTSIVRRMKSRFARKGKLPGILCVVSSKTTNDSFTETLISEAMVKKDPTVFVRDRSLVDVKRESFSDETFKVLVGNESYPSKILKKDEDLSKYSRKCLIIDVPEDLRPDFEANLEEGLRELMGVSTVAISSFMSRVDLVDKMKDPDRSHPFLCPLMANPMEWNSVLPYRINWQKLAKQQDNGDWVPLVNPHAPRFVHLDPAKSGDAFGLAIGHISHMVPVRERVLNSDEVMEYQPHFHIDFMLRIKGTKGEEVLFKNVRDLLYAFAYHGFHFSRITTDTYQSVEMIQALVERGYKAEVLSVDTSKEPYRYLRRTIYDQRIKCYDYPMLFQELKGLEENEQKIDHKPNDSKDMADSVCGLVFSLFEERDGSYPNLPVKGISEYPDAPGVRQVVDEDFAQQEAKERVEEKELEKQSTPMEFDLNPNAPKVYVKKHPKTVAPKYQKRKTDGGVEDLRAVSVFDPEEIMVRG